MDSRNEEFKRLLKKYREQPSKADLDRIWFLVDSACNSVCSILTRGIKNENWYDRKMDAVVTIMSKILEDKVNPDVLITYCYLWCQGSMQGVRAQRIDQEYSTEVLFDSKDWSNSNYYTGEEDICQPKQLIAQRKSARKFVRI